MLLVDSQNLTSGRSAMPERKWQAFVASIQSQQTAGAVYSLTPVFVDSPGATARVGLFGGCPGGRLGEARSAVAAGVFFSSSGGGDTGDEPTRGGGGDFFEGGGRVDAGPLASALDGRTPARGSY